MPIDPRLDKIDDCLYRVAVKVVIVKENKILLIKEASDNWWALPGGGIDHGETLESALVREIEEEIGVPADEVRSDFEISYYHMGAVVNGIPRMNLFVKASVPENLIKQTQDITEWGWFTKDQFMNADLQPTFPKAELVEHLFDK